jgi:serine/threonine protein kinase
MNDKSKNLVFGIFMKNHNLKVKKTLGKGGFGEVREIEYKGKTYAGKLVKKMKNKFINEDIEKEIIIGLKGPKIVKVYKIYEETYKDETYILYIMEKAYLKDLKTLIKFMFESSSLINKAFNETIGDNLLKFFVKQIIDSLELLNRNNYLHFDIKPENILNNLEINLKLSDFGLLRDSSNIDSMRIPGGTPGYLSPEYYQHQKLSVDRAKKQDIFALGATIYYLKYGQKMLKINKEDSDREKLENIIFSLQRKITYIQSNKICDRDFVQFLCSMIQIYPDDRPSFEQIYRNKWVNKNSEYIKNIFEGHKDDERKLMIELKKSDFLVEKKIERKKRIVKKKKFIFKK